MEHDREIVDHSMNHKIEGASYDYGYQAIKSILTLLGVLLNLIATCELEENFATFIIYACYFVFLISPFFFILASIGITTFKYSNGETKYEQSSHSNNQGIHYYVISCTTILLISKVNSKENKTNIQRSRRKFVLTFSQLKELLKTFPLYVVRFVGYLKLSDRKLNGTNFCEFREFWPFSRNLIPRNINFLTHENYSTKINPIKVCMRSLNYFSKISITVFNISQKVSPPQENGIIYQGA